MNHFLSQNFDFCSLFWDVLISKVWLCSLKILTFPHLFDLMEAKKKISTAKFSFFFVVVVKTGFFTVMEPKHITSHALIPQHNHVSHRKNKDNSVTKFKKKSRDIHIGSYFWFQPVQEGKFWVGAKTENLKTLFGIKFWFKALDSTFRWFFHQTPFSVTQQPNEKASWMIVGAESERNWEWNATYWVSAWTCSGLSSCLRNHLFGFVEVVKVSKLI